MTHRPMLPDAFDKLLYCGYFLDDFYHYVDTRMWTAVTEGSVALAAAGEFARGGVVKSKTGNNNNNESYIISTWPVSSHHLDETMGCAMRYKLFDPGTANMIFGFLEDATADSLVDNGGGVMVDKDCALIYKVDGETTFRCHARVAGETPQDTISQLVCNNTTNGGDITAPDDWTTLKIDCVGTDYETEIGYFYDPDGFGAFRPLVDLNNKPIKHRLRTAGSINSQMKLIMGNKTGHALRCDLNIDWAAYWISR